MCTEFNGGRICLPLTSVDVAFSIAKFTDASKQGGGEPSLHEEPVPLTASRITKLECVPPKGRCYGDFINNITFCIHVPYTPRKARQVGTAEQGGKNNYLALPPPPQHPAHQ